MHLRGSSPQQGLTAQLLIRWTILYRFPTSVSFKIKKYINTCSAASTLLHVFEGYKDFQLSIIEYLMDINTLIQELFLSCQSSYLKGRMSLDLDFWIISSSSHISFCPQKEQCHKKDTNSPL